MASSEWNIWQQHLLEASVTTRDIAELASCIAGDALLTQRAGFDRGKFQAAPAKKNE